MDWTQLTPEEQAQFLQEAAELSGTNDNDSAATDDVINTDNPEVNEGGDNDHQDVKESKTEKKIKKLLSKKNQAEHDRDALQERLAKLEAESERNKFLADFPDAKEHFEKIEGLLEQKPWLSREDAFFILQGKWEIRSTAPSSSFTGRPATGLSTPKDITKWTTADMEAYLKQNYSAWGLKWFLN